MPKEPIKKNASAVIRQSVELVQGEGQKHYSNMLQGKATNALSHSSKRGHKVDPFTGVGSLLTAEGVQVFLENFNNVSLNVQTHKVLDALTLELTSNFPHGAEATADQINKHRAVILSVNDYAELCGIKDKKEARKQLKEAITTLFNVVLEWDEIGYIVPDGKKRRTKQVLHHKLRVSDHIITDESENPIKGGKVAFKFSFEIAEYLSHAYIMPYPGKLLTVNSKRNPHSYYIGRKLAEHHNMNIGKPNTNRISVKAILEALPDLPSYNEVINTAGKNVTQQIIQPFERDLIALKNTYGILASWKYCNSKGEPLTEEQVESCNYSTWEQWLIEFELADYPDQNERLAKIAERKKIATKRKSQGKNKSNSSKKE